MLQTEQQPANAEAQVKATELKRDIQAQTGIATESAQPNDSGMTPTGKPLVEAPEFGDRVCDTDKDPYWIPGVFPTIFQNETGDLHNYYNKEPDMLTWGPHIMRARGWYAQDRWIL